MGKKFQERVTASRQARKDRQWLNHCNKAPNGYHFWDGSKCAWCFKTYYPNVCGECGHIDDYDYGVTQCYC